MKLKIRKTGEIVDVISFSCDTERKPTDVVDYIDSKGVEHPNEKFNYYWDLEPIHISNIDWEQRRYEIAKDVLCALIETHYNSKDDSRLPSVWDVAIGEANLLIRLLKNTDYARE